MARKENALDLAKFIDKGVRVKLSGGREGEYQHVEILNVIPCCFIFLQNSMQEAHAYNFLASSQTLLCAPCSGGCAERI